MSVFHLNGRAPSLAQVVALAQAHVNERSRQRARSIDYAMAKGPNFGKASKIPRTKDKKVTRSKRENRSSFERINEKYSKFYHYDE